MAHSDENKPKNEGQRMRERALRGIPEEARLPEYDKPDLLEGTSREIAFIDDDGTICINYFEEQRITDGTTHKLGAASVS